LDLRPSNPLDPPSVISVRASEAVYFLNWMMEAREEKYGITEPVNLRNADFPWAQLFLKSHTDLIENQKN